MIGYGVNVFECVPQFKSWNQVRIFTKISLNIVRREKILM